MKQSKNTKRAFARGRALGSLHWLIGAIENFDPESLYPDELATFKALRLAAIDMKKHWRKKLPSSET